MTVVVALVGHISAGKTSTAIELATLLDATYIGSDEIQDAIAPRDPTELRTTVYQNDPTADEVFLEMGRIVDRVRTAGGRAVLDSTGMHENFHATIARHRDVTTVVLLHCDENTWRSRELQRADRLPLDTSIRNASHAGAEQLKPDLRLDTAGRTPAELARAIHTWLSERDGTAAIA